MASSAIPAAVNAFTAALRASLTAVDVFDGPPMRGESFDYVCVGYDPAGGPESVEAGQESAALGNRRRAETFDIICSLAAWSGEDEMAPRRARAFEMLAAVEQVLRDNVTLSGTVQAAQLSSYSLLQEQTDQGASAGIRFRVSCTARI